MKMEDKEDYQKLPRRRRYGGRRKGTPNRSTAELKAMLERIVWAHLDNFDALYEALEPAQKADLLVALAKLLIPRPTPTPVADDGPAPYIWVDNNVAKKIAADHAAKMAARGLIYTADPEGATLPDSNDQTT